MIAWLKERNISPRRFGCRSMDVRWCSNTHCKLTEPALSFREKKELVLFSIPVYGFSCQLTSKPAISRFRLWIKGLSWLGVKWLGSLHKAGPLKCVYAVWTALCLWSSPKWKTKRKQNEFSIWNREKTHRFGMHNILCPVWLQVMKERYVLLFPIELWDSGWCKHL